VPDSIKRRRAGRLAHEQFFEQRLHLTRARTGVLIFVSVAEHYVEIIADQGFNALVPPGTWDKAVSNFVEPVRAGEKTGRQARLVELDPRYCDVIVQRWQDWAGGTATLEGNGRSFAEVATARGTAYV
jgi:hypothetical protein